MTPLSTRTKLDLGDLYYSNDERTAHHIEFYRTLYGLPRYHRKYEVTPQLYDYCCRRKFFVNIVAFHSDKVFLTRYIGRRLGWSLPGSTVHSRENELFQDAVHRILNRDLPTVAIGELRPIAYLEKTYICGDHHGDQPDQSVTHRGITFMARVRDPLPSFTVDEDVKGQFVAIDDRRELLRVPEFDRLLVLLAADHIGEERPLDHQTIDDEIRATDKIGRIAHWLHKYSVGAAGRLWSSRPLKSEILKYVEEGDYFLDIACGDDEFIWQVADKAQLCLGNDVQWGLIKGLIAKQRGQGRQQTSKAQKVIFVNHDARALPFQKRFDLVMCKNVLHHMSSKDQLESLLSSMRNVARKVLIVDPVEPSETLRGRLWHWYYARLLHDQGEKFFPLSLLEETIRGYYTDATSVDISLKPTIKGRFMLCLVTFPSDSAKDLSSAWQDGAIPSTGEDILRNCKAVIFDFDGLLFDTERLFLDAIHEVLHRRGVAIEDEDYIERDMQNGRSLFKHLHDVGLVEDIQELTDDVYSAYDLLLDNGVRAMPGAIELVAALHRQCKLAIASSSKRSFIDKVLRQHGLNDKFDIIISRENTSWQKPNPECFRLALRGLKLRSEECVVVEDSMRGLEAAKALGLRCVIVPNAMTHTAEFEGADLRLGSLGELLPTPTAPLG